MSIWAIITILGIKLSFLSQLFITTFFLGNSYAFILSYLHVSWGFLLVGLAVFLQNGVLFWWVTFSYNVVFLPG